MAQAEIIIPAQDRTTWADVRIQVESYKGYRNAFVKTFQAHEGRKVHDDNDMPVFDESNRACVVTRASFAREFGLTQRSFYEWCEVVADSATTSDEDSEDESTTEDEEPDEDDEIAEELKHYLETRGGGAKIWANFDLGVKRLEKATSNRSLSLEEATEAYEGIAKVVKAVKAIERRIKKDDHSPMRVLKLNVNTLKRLEN